ncbi:MAG TPA: GFA family protein [Methyloceanibacter sp.]
MTIRGGCLCGAVRYEIEAEPITARVCWCRRCQKIGAGSGTVNVVFPAEAVSVKGELGDFKSVADGGNNMHTRFCPKCGTPVFTGAESRPHLVVVRAGTLDDPEVGAPAITIWTEEAPSWAAFDPELPHDPGQPPPPVLAGHK